MKKLLLFAIVLSGVLMFACKKNNSGGTPVITHVRTVNPAQADSFFTQAAPGTLVVIQGSGFNGLKAVFFNDSLATVNTVYATNTNIIVSIPGGTQTAATDPKVPNQIKVITDHGTALYSFSVVLDAPVITAITFDNTGSVLYIQGKNLVGISKITFPVGAQGNYDTATGYSINTTWTQITAGVPPGTSWTDSLRVYATFGVASFPYPPPMTITAVSNENAIAGDSITLTGTNFINVTSLTFPGGITVTPTVLSVSQMAVKVPVGIGAPDTIRISGQLGNASATQLFDSYLTHPSPGYLSTFDGNGAGDNTGFVGWTGGYGTGPSATYPNSTGSFGLLTNGGSISGNTGNGGNQGNPGFLQLNDVPWVSNTSVAAAGYSMKFEVYVAAPWKAGAIWVMTGDWYGWQHVVARVAPWDVSPGDAYRPDLGWTTITIPLSQFINPLGATSVIANGSTQAPVTDGNVWDYGSFPVGGLPLNKISDFGPTAVCFTMVNDQASPTVPAGGINVAIDNVRIVKGK
jgi:hypothetical protein